MDEQLDKQEPATPFKLEEARKRGQIARSAELVGFTMLVCMIAGIAAVMPVLAKAVERHAAWWLSNASFLASDGATLRHHGVRIASDILLDHIAPIVAAAVLVTIVVSVVHAGVVWSSHPLKPDFNRISPATGFKRVFSRRNAVDALKVCAKLIAFACAFCLLYPSLMRASAVTLDATPHATAGYWLAEARVLAIALLGVYAVFALFDLWFTKRDFARQMRMSRRDLKDEHKRREGDPEIRARRRKKQLELLKRIAGVARVKDADVIITNPTHVAVALRYRANKDPLPMAVAMGAGITAKMVTSAARRHGVPILRRPALARALLKDGAIGRWIPVEHQEAVAAVYRWVLTRPGNKVFS